MKPFFRYFGSKYNLAKNFHHKYDLVIEPFAGSACFSLYHNCANVILNDKNTDISELWQFLTTATEKEVLDIPSDLEIGSNIYDMQLSLGQKHLVRYNQRIGSQNCKTVSKWGCNKYNYLWSENKKKLIASQLAQIKNWEVRNLDYKDLDNVEATWFIDPPYQSQSPKFYGEQMEAINYEELADFCRSRKGQVIVCENEGASWLPFEKLAKSQNKIRAKRTDNPKFEMVYVQ